MVRDPLAPGTSPSLSSPYSLSRLRPGHGSANMALPRKAEKSWGKLLCPRLLATRLFLSFSRTAGSLLFPLPSFPSNVRTQTQATPVLIKAVFSSAPQGPSAHSFPMPH